MEEVETVHSEFEMMLSIVILTSFDFGVRFCRVLRSVDETVELSRDASQPSSLRLPRCNIEVVKQLRKIARAQSS